MGQWTGPHLPPGIFRGAPREQRVLAGHPFHSHSSSAHPVPRAGLDAGFTMTKRTSGLEQSSGLDGGEPSAPCPWLADPWPWAPDALHCVSSFTFATCPAPTLPPFSFPWDLGAGASMPLPPPQTEQEAGTGASHRIWNLKDRLQLPKAVETYVLFSGCAPPPAS